MEEQRQSLETVINKWVKNQPAWYSAALHIALQGAYTDEQIDVLASAACKEQGVDLGVENPVTLAAYQPADLGGAGDAQRSVLLESITAESGINAIEKGPKLNVATSGITVIYGNNAQASLGSVASCATPAPHVRARRKFSLTCLRATTLHPLLSARANGVPTTCTWKSGESDYPTFPEIAFFRRRLRGQGNW